MDRFSDEFGFTLVEIIALLLVIAIVSAIVTARWSNPDYDVVVQKDITTNHLRYAQIKAISTNSPWYITITENTYQLFEGGGTPVLKKFPGEDTTTVTLLEGVACSIAGSTISYNEWGQPATDTGATSLQSANRTLTFTKAGESSTITMVNNTGLLR